MGTYYNPENGVKLNIAEMKLPKFAKDWLRYLLVEVNLAPRTIFDYSVSVHTFLRWAKSIQAHIPAKELKNADVHDMQVSDIASFDKNDIYEFLSFCTTELGNSAVSRAAKLAAVRSLYTFLKDRYADSGVRENPAKEITTPKKESTLPKFLSLEETKKLLSAVAGEAPARDYCMILWFLTCGMRLTEIVTINVGDIKGENLRIYGKGRKERIVYLNGPCRDALENYLIERNGWHIPENEHALFVSKRTGKRLTGRRVEQIVEDNLARAGLQGNGFSPHKLRHTAATLMYQSGSADILEIKEILGHASVSTTQIYCHTAGNMVKSALNSMGNLIGGNQEREDTNNETN